ncbi:ABC transporter ATP-binding protein [Acidobacteriota bacterium]
MITIKSLVKTFGRITAVSDLSLEVSKGEVFGFLGPNGAGKTTTVKILAGVTRPTSGTALLGGYDILKEPMMAKRITAYIPDSPFVYEKLTGLEFLKFIGGLYSLNHSNLEKQATELLERFSLEDRAHELVEGYSHGMRQKLVFCAALIIDPRILVVDEPMVGLDPKSARMVKNLMRDMCEEGRTVFMSTHSLDVASRICDRIGIIQEGTLRALGTMDELHHLAGTTDPDLENIFLTITNEADS